ncbi:TPA: 16S rRNA (guanine(527)-N(7))-methyltransferase RsmG, partial [Kluyvera ascorbata]|nr:16S rRNA (guanine(527)-N(7))-methyltransferase RsmG [Kluyvera ascorbata]
MLNKLSRLLNEAGISLSDHQKNQLVAYVDMLHKWNKAYNLTSVRDPNEMLVRHILDSIVVAPSLEGERFIDVGTGPGLPGIPLSIVRPDAHFTLLDSLGKRVRFLRQVQHELALTNITPVQSRVEDFPADPPFDGVISRAFASLTDMVTWCH